jgi:glycosyltransferase involved in cell wall biosynthesis
MKTKSGKKLSVSIGIPAFNEEGNIGFVLRRLINQKQKDFQIQEIIVATDGSTDKTVSIVKSFKNPRIKLIQGNKRIGQQKRQNKLMKIYKGDILVLIEADTLPTSNFTLNELIKPFKTNKNLGMVTGNSLPTKPEKFFEKVLYQGSILKEAIFEEWKNGQNVYTFGGHSIKALSKKCTQILLWPDDAPEDSYVYLRLKQLGFELKRSKKAVVYKRHVTTVSDRFRQTSKFVSGRRTLVKYFGQNFIQTEYKIPFYSILKHLVMHLVKNPFWISAYLFEAILNRLLTVKKTQFNPLYRTYQTSKKLNII